MMEHIAKVYRRVINVITNGIQTAPVTQRNGVAYVQIQANAFSTAEYPMMQHYGFSSIPLNGALHYKIAMAGDKSNAVSIGSNDSRYRPATLTDGDSCLWDDSGQSIRINSQGQIIAVNAMTELDLQINGTTVCKVTSSGILVTGTITATGEITGNNIPLSTHLHTGVSSGDDNTGMPIV